MNELIIEIQEDIRRERLAKLWHSFGKTMVALSVAVILATVAAVVVQNRRQARAMERTTQFISGIDRLGIEDYKGAAAIFDALSKDENSPYYGMAMLRKAQAQSGSGDKAGAAKTYAALAAHGHVFGGLAAMLVPSDKPIVPDKSSPFYYTQSEWEAWQLLQEGRKDEAVALFTQLHDDADAPTSMRERAAEVVQYAASEQPPAAKEEHHD